MILVDKEIRCAVESGDIQISPYDPRMIQPSSIDLTLSGSVVRGIGKAREYRAYYEDSFILEPGEFALGATVERIGLPRFITGSVWGKSSIGRQGKFIENAGHIDPGFEGTITLELYNASPDSVVFTVGDPICQIVFHRHTNCEKDYAEKGGKYQGQILATGAR